ncbi:MAG TPA: Clp1/GlmU family protein [Candidatus Xenobia bacterium]
MGIEPFDDFCGVEQGGPMGDLEIPESWHELATTLRSTAQVAMVLGAQHVGKSTLIRWLASELARGGQRVGLLDADLGQSNVGPPGTVGLASVRKPFHTYSELAPSALFFVGALSPVGHEGATVTGLTKLMKLARRLGNQTTLVNTSGYLDPAFVAGGLKAVEPALVIGLEVEGELAGLVPEGATLKTVRPAQAAVRKTDRERSSNREESFARYFDHAQVWAVLPMQVKVQSPKGVDAPLVPGTLVGLLDGAGVCHGVGVALTPSEGCFRIFSPLQSLGNIQKVLTGAYQTSPEQLKLWMSQSA